MILKQVAGVIFLLFVLCFLAIIVEECFIGGRRRRKLERAARAKLNEGSGKDAGERAVVSGNGAVS